MKIIHIRFPPGVSGSQVLRRVYDSGTSLSIIPLRQGRHWDVSLLVLDELSHRLLNELLSNSPGIGVSSFDMPVAPERTFDRPIIILGCPRSGTTLLFETLAKCANVWTIGGESYGVIDRHARQFDGVLPRDEVEDRGNRLDASDADPDACKRVIGGFLSVVRDREGRLYIEREPAERPGSIRLLEKMPINSLRIPFLRRIFPDCRFIFLYRDPWANIGSLIDGWQYNERQVDSQHARGVLWTYLYPPGWRGLIGKPIADIAAAQWRATNELILRDLMNIPREHWIFIEYERLVTDSENQIRKLCEFTSLEIDGVLDSMLKHPLPFSRNTRTPPHPEKWRRHEKELNRVMPSLQAITAKIEKIQRLQNELTARQFMS
jgi:sulfotransferase family protein